MYIRSRYGKNVTPPSRRLDYSGCHRRRRVRKAARPVIAHIVITLRSHHSDGDEPRHYRGSAFSADRRNGDTDGNSDVLRRFESRCAGQLVDLESSRRASEHQRSESWGIPLAKVTTTGSVRARGGLSSHGERVRASVRHGRSVPNVPGAAAVAGRVSVSPKAVPAKRGR